MNFFDTAQAYGFGRSERLLGRALAADLRWPDPATPIGETAAALADLVREGLIGHIGVSNYSAAQIEEFSAIAPVERSRPNATPRSPSSRSPGCSPTRPSRLPS